ncbi:MAG: HigA family addiction module antitoxin [Pyrinomonadaceae bacterium]
MNNIGNHTTPIHPGLVLQDELDELGISQSTIAAHIGVLPKTINEICRGKRGISVEIAFKLSMALGASPNFWLNLQNNWELSKFDTAKLNLIGRVPEHVANI